MSIEEQLATATSEISVLKNSLRVATETEQRCRELFDATTEMWRQDALALAAMTAENELHKSLLQPLEHSRSVCQERLTTANSKVEELTQIVNRVAEQTEGLPAQLRASVDTGSVGPREALQAADMIEALAHTQQRYNRNAEQAREQLAAMTQERDKAVNDCIEFASALVALEAEVAELKTELERERIRLAACGSAALGYYDGCKDEYKSASLDDVLRLRKDAERWRFQNSLPDLSPYLREYHSGVLLSTEDIDAALKEAQS